MKTKHQKYPNTNKNNYASDRFRQLIRMCVGKASFKKEEDALARAVKWGHRAYKCPQCQHYHLTKKLLDK